MHRGMTKRKIMRLSMIHQLPPALITWRLTNGFPVNHIGCTDLDHDIYVKKPFEQQPYIPIKTYKNTTDRNDPPHYTPASPEDYGHIKVTRKKKPRF